MLPTGFNRKVYLEPGEKIYTEQLIDTHSAAIKDEQEEIE